MHKKLYRNIIDFVSEEKKMLAILIDPDKFRLIETESFLKTIPKETTHIFIGGSTVEEGLTENVVAVIKSQTSLPILLFPGDFTQVNERADGLLFLSLISGRNPE